MFSHVRNVVNKVSSAMGMRNEDDNKTLINDVGYGRLNHDLTYQRPVFLDLSKDEEKSVLDHKLRHLVAPKDHSILSFNSGYCETVNGGKSVLNEDCAVSLTVILDSLPKTHCDRCQGDGCSTKKDISAVAEKDTSINTNSLPSDNPENKPEQITVSSSENTIVSTELQTLKIEEADDIEKNKSSSLDKINETGDTGSTNVAKSINNEALATKKDNDSQNTADKPPLKSDDDTGPHLRKVNLVTEPNPKRVCTCTGKTLRLDYFAIFDGHAGEGAALYASAVLHEILIERLREVQHLLLKEETSNPHLPDCLTEPTPTRNVTVTSLQADTLIIGLLQDVMLLTDKHMVADQEKYTFYGGCTVVLVVFILGKMYVAGAGDSRAVLYTSSGPIPSETPGIVTCVDMDDSSKVHIRHMSHDFTPVTERRRLQYLAFLKPSLLGDHFTRYEFIRRIRADDVGRKVLHRDYHMTGWTYKEITRDDLRLPMVSGMGRAKRLLATIGVTRGLGDHKLVALNQLFDVPVKPFMSAVPEVRIHDLSDAHGPNDVLVMASDGLWDVMSSEMVAKQVTATLRKFDVNDSCRYTAAAKDLVLTARGTYTPSGGWRMVNEKPASVDDITVFVIPLLGASQKHL